MTSNTAALVYTVAAAVLLMAHACGTAAQHSAPLVDNQDSMMDLDAYPLAYYPTGGAVAAMDAVDLMDLETRSAALPPLSRAQLQRLLQHVLFAQPNAAEALAALLPSASAGYGRAVGNAAPLAAAQRANKPLYGAARLLRMPMPMPEMKRTARGRSMQCYFNPISCY